MRKQVSLIMVLTLLCTLFALPVWAESSSKAFTSNPVVVAPRAMTMLQEGTAFLSVTGSGNLVVNCSTSAFYSVDEIGLEIHLQRRNGSSWTTVQTFPFAKYNSSSITKVFSTNAAKGYNYRLYTSITAERNFLRISLHDF
jgi:hypothetical protein